MKLLFLVSKSFSEVLTSIGFCCILILFTIDLGDAAKKTTKSLIEEVNDQKELKKLLRTKNNVLVAFFSKASHASNAAVHKTLKELSDVVKGIGTVVTVDCNDANGKKLCKKLKVNPSSHVIKHYKDGEFNVDYGRAERLASFVTFMKDPTGDLPWDEDDAATDVVHLADPKQFGQFLKRERGRVLIMFYTPWCGYCKRMKPDYALAAADVSSAGDAVMAAMDVNKPENSAISKKYNITGFPTLLYFEGGVVAYKYPGENNRKALVDFLRDPKPESASKPSESEWKDEPSAVVHLTSETFAEFIAREPNVVVMFYAPWCGHCKRMKPEFVEAAEAIKKENVPGKLAAVDCTKETDIAAKYGVKSYPTVKYFRSGELAFDAGHARDAQQIVDFIKDPTEPPPPPPPEKPWSEEEGSEVVHLTEETFKSFLKKKKHVLVMFYAPWCGHCKKAKPELSAAAQQLADNPRLAFAAVDCTLETAVCKAHDVDGYPHFKYFQYFNKEQRTYDGGRTTKDFLTFMSDPENPMIGQPPAPPTPEASWSSHDGGDLVAHLRNDNFHDFLNERINVLVMFYAPWCGHCAAMKGEYAGAAKRLSEDGLGSPTVALAALDATAETDVAQEYGVKGYPTLRLFRRGKAAEEYNGGRRKMDFVDYMKKKAKEKDEL